MKVANENRLDHSGKLVDDVLKLVDKTIDPYNLLPPDACIFLEDLIGRLQFRLNTIREIGLGMSLH
jgi:hypothetical protein